ncbi:MAG: hypothetical protein FWF50_03820 [Defluviitaleaceae bacterium]|nr:hypothetical protein [Defluviitaleaceae bacterium]
MNKKKYMRKMFIATLTSILAFGHIPLNISASQNLELDYVQESYENYKHNQNLSFDEVNPLLIEFFSNLDNSNLPKASTIFYLEDGTYVEIRPQLARRTVRTIRNIMLISHPITGTWQLPNIAAGTLLTVSHTMIAHQDRSTWYFVPNHLGWNGQIISGWVNRLDVQ